MDKLEYKIGNIEIDKEKLEFFGKDPSESKHKFLVVGQGTGLIAYMGPKGHVKIVKQNKIESVRVLGGGSVYLNKNGDLVLDHLSYIYGAVPDKVACEFAKLIQKELKKSGLKIKKTIVKPKGDLNERWLLYGFD